MASKEMLQQVLDEFDNKETLISGERTAIEEQIIQLETRLDNCHKRLETIAQDRERVEAMKERYVGFLDVPTKSDIKPSAVVQPPEPAPIPADIPIAKLKPPEETAIESTADKTKPVKSKVTKAATEEPVDGEEKKESPTETDTVKSINEALRSLFR